MLKLGRNQFGSNVIIDGENNNIEWKYIKMLNESQKYLPCNLDNKLTKEHMQWACRKMNVRLAAETLSNSVADSLEFLKSESVEFENVDATVKYIRIFNDIFDIMNSTTSGRVTGFKEPISMSTYREYFRKFEEAMRYLKQLRRESAEKPIFLTQNGTAFFGFHNDMVNFMRIFEEYVLTGRLEALITHRFSQDHIESLFGCIRSVGGFNDNPTAQQFEAAYRKLLIHNDVVYSKKSNTIDGGTKILTVSSQRPAQRTEVALLNREELAKIDEWGHDFLLSFDATEYMDDTSNHSLAFMSHVVERKIVSARPPRLPIECQQCITTFIENELITDEFIKFKSCDS